MPAMYSVQDIVERVRAEFMEMPGLRLTTAQIQRLCGIEPNVCRAVLDSLVQAGFLWASPNGTYARVSDERIARPSPARGSVERALDRRASHAGRRTA